MSTYDGLSPKHRRFVNSYIENHFNGAKAARDVGYSPIKAKNRAWELLRDEKITAAIEERVQVLIMPKTEVVSRLSSLARTNIGDYVQIGADGQTYIDLSDIDDSQAYGIKKLRIKRVLEDDPADDGESREVEFVEIEVHDPKPALNVLAKHLGLLDDTIHVKLTKEIDDALDRLEAALPPAEYEKVLRVLASEDSDRINQG